MKKTIILMFLMILPIVIATPSFYIEERKDYDLKVACFDADNSFCLVATECNVTISTPNSTVIVNNLAMSFNPSYYNYTIKNNNLRTLGEYQVITQCTGATEGFQTFSFEVTFDGNAPSTKQNTGLNLFYIMLASSFLFLIIGFWREDATLMSVAGIGFVITGLFIAINDFIGLSNLMTQFLIIALWALGFYIFIRTQMEQFDEGG